MSKLTSRQSYAFTSYGMHQNTFTEIIFELGYILVKDDSISVVISGILKFIQYLQISFFAFQPTILYKVWRNRTVSSIISDILGYPAIIQIYQDGNQLIFEILYIFFLSIVLIISFLQLYSFYMIKMDKQIPNIIQGTIRLFTHLFFSVLYLPITYTFIFMLNCNTTNGRQYHQIFSDLECFKGIHLYYVISGIFLTIILLLNVFFMSLLFFDGIQNSKKVLSVKDNNCCIFLFIYQTILIFSFNFLGEDQAIYLVCIYSIGAFIDFFLTYGSKKFYNPSVMLYRSIFCAYNCWTASLYVISYISEGYIFDGVIYAWLIGIPFILASVLMTLKKQKKGYRDINVNDIQTPFKIIDHFNYINQLLEEDQKNSENKLINGYLEFHKKTCLNHLCASKRIKLVSNETKQARASKIIIQEVFIHDKNMNLLNQIICQMFEKGIIEFPVSIDLKINYSYFQMKMMRNRQAALKELINIDQKNCRFEQKYNLYAIKRTIEQQGFNMGKINQFDFQEINDLEQRIQNFKFVIGKTVLLFIDFWQQINEDKPDLIKLQQIGDKLFPSKKRVEEMWQQISRFKCEGIPQVLRLYSKYLIDIFQDHQEGQILIEQSIKLDSIIQAKKQQHLSVFSEANITGKEDGFVFMALQGDKSGQITAFNKSFTNMLGYSKNELLGCSVNTLMPFVYSKNHDDILKVYRQTNEPIMQNKERPVHAKLKNGYIQSFHLLLKPVQCQLQEEQQFVGRFQKEVYQQQICNIITTSEGIIKDVSASIHDILGISEKIIFNHQTNITQIIPDIFNYLDSNETKNGHIITYNRPKLDHDFAQDQVSSQVSLYVHIKPINLQSLNKHEGYCIKIELLNKKTETNSKKYKSKIKHNSDASIVLNNSSMDQENSLLQLENSVFQFKLAIVEDNSNQSKNTQTSFGLVGKKGQVRYIGELFELQSQKNTNDFSNQTFIVEQNVICNVNRNTDCIRDIDLIQMSNVLNNTSSNIVFFKKKSENQNQNDDIEKPKINYGEGYKIYRWNNGYLQEIDKEDSDEDQQQKQQIKNNNNNNNKNIAKQQDQMTKNDYEYLGQKSKNFSDDQLCRQTESKQIRHLSYIFYIYIFFLILMSTLDYTSKLSQKEIQLKNLFTMILASHQLSQLQLIVSATRELVFSQQNIRIPQYSLDQTPPDINQDTQILRKMIENSINMIENYTTLLNDYSKIQSQQINVQFDLETQSTFDLTYAVQQFISKSNGVLKLTDQQIMCNQSDVFFVLYNGMNVYPSVLFDLLNIYYEKYYEGKNTLNDDNMTIIIITIIIILFFSLIIVFLLKRILIAKQTILNIFLNITHKTTKQLFINCENFLQEFMNQDQDEEFELDEPIWKQQQLDNESETKTNVFGIKKKKFKNTVTGLVYYLIMVFLIGIIFDFYYITNYLQGQIKLNSMQAVSDEFQTTVQMEPYFSFALNAELQYFLEPSWPVYNVQNFDQITKYINKCMELNIQINLYEAVNNQEHSNLVDYQLLYQSVMFEDACKLVAENNGISIEECQNFNSGIIKTGFALTLINYIELMNFKRDRIQWINSNQGKIFDFSGYGFEPQNTSSNSTKYNFQNLLKMNDTYVLLAVQNLYLKSIMNGLQEAFYGEFVIRFDQYMLERILFITIFIIIIIFCSIICLLPYLAQINKEIWATKNLLSFIPQQEVLKNKVISHFIRQIILEKNL